MQYDKQQEQVFMSSPNLKEYFQRYILDIRGCKQSTAKHYIDALTFISKMLRDKKLVTKDIFEVGSLEQLDMLWEILRKDPDFIQLNKRGHSMYSAGFNNYRKFASGQDFHKIHDKFTIIDKPMAVEKTNTMEYQVWKRSGILRTQTIEYASYSCEMDEGHKTFLAASNHKPYMEAHHIIPLHLQDSFQYSLDVYANLICLCPICHRRIHYGIYEDRLDMLYAIYEKRKARLGHCGIQMSKESFEQTILNQ